MIMMPLCTTSNAPLVELVVAVDESAFCWERAQTYIIFTIDLAKKNINSKAKNAIMFLGDGMDITTMTAARILKGQEKGNSGPEDSLVWDEFHNVALSKVFGDFKNLSGIICELKLGDRLVSYCIPAPAYSPPPRLQRTIIFCPYKSFLFVFYIGKNRNATIPLSIVNGICQSLGVCSLLLRDVPSSS